MARPLTQWFQLYQMRKMSPDSLFELLRNELAAFALDFKAV